MQKKRTIRGVTARARIIDQVGRHLISIGGIGIIAAVMGILLFILIEAYPLFQSPDLFKTATLRAERALAIGMDPYHAVAYIASDEGVGFLRLDDGRVIGIRSVIGPGAKLFNSIMMGADFYETPIDIERNSARGIPNVGIGANASINRAIIDKNARIGERVIINNEEGVREAEGDNYYIRDGIVVVPKDAIINSGTII